MTGYGPTLSLTVFVTVQVTFGTFAGTRPSTSRSKSSTISGRRLSNHISAEVTGCPFFSVRIGGIIGKRIRFRLVVIRRVRRVFSPLGAGRRALMPSWSIMLR